MSQESKIQVMELIAEEYDQLRDYKSDMDRRIQHQLANGGIHDKIVQRAVIKAAKALSNDKLEDTCAESGEVSELCRTKMSPGPLFEAEGGHNVD